MRGRLASATLFTAVLCVSSAQSESSTCTTTATEDIRLTGAVAINTALAVNPDGTAASYTPGDHGYTYINNGVNLIQNGKKISCSIKINNRLCREKWAKAEKGSFAAGTPEFCSFAIEVVQFGTGLPRVNCEGRKSRFILGNAKGRPAIGNKLTNVEGQTVVSYRSMTTLRHTINDAPSYVDSGVIPGLVVPTARHELVGAIAWVRYGNRSSFAIVNDTGPAFGEGTIALHQVLGHASIPLAQPIGPIPLHMRCTMVETLAKPFQSRPDAVNDGCRPGYQPKSASDIRAYAGIDDSEVQSVILPKVRPPMVGNRVIGELTPASIKAAAIAAGFDERRLSAMADCAK